MTQAFGLGCDVAGPSALNEGQESSCDLSVERDEDFSISDVLAAC